MKKHTERDNLGRIVSRARQQPVDAPQDGETYQITGAAADQALINGDNWQDSRVVVCAECGREVALFYGEALPCLACTPDFWKFAGHEPLRADGVRPISASFMPVIDAARRHAAKPCRCWGCSTDSGPGAVSHGCTAGVDPDEWAADWRRITD